MEEPKGFGDEPKKTPPIKSIHTYATDMASAVKDGQGSVIKIAMAESKKREAEKENITPTTRKNIWFIAGGISLVVLGIGIAIFFIIKSATVGTVPIDTKSIPPSIIFSDGVKVIEITDLSPDKVINTIGSEVRNLTTRLDDITYIYFLDRKSGAPKKVTTQEFLSAIESSAPDGLTRNFNADFMMGIHTYDGNQLFIILKVTDYKNGFAGMLSWERTLFDDMYRMFDIDVSGENKIVFTKKFEDKIVENKDARVLYGIDGTPTLFYIFLDDTTVLIARDRDAVKEVMTRFKSAK